MKDSDSVVLMSELGQTIRMSMRDLRVLGRSTQGVRLVSLPNDVKVVAVQKIEEVEKASVDIV